jgi:AcrR family transcriptional regulator
MVQTRREEILEAAAMVFAEKGFHAATMEEIAIQAGIGKSTVYEYFSSKEELFREMFQMGVSFYLDAMQGRLQQPCSVRDILTAIAAAHFKFIVERNALARVLADEQGPPLPWVREWLLQLRERKLAMLSELISRGIELGELRQVEPRLASELFLGVIGSICMPVICNYHPDDPIEPLTAEDIAEMQERLLKGMDIFFSGIAAS